MTDTAKQGEDMTEQEWDDDMSDVVKTVGRQVRLWRERNGLTQAELGAAIGYGEDQVSSVERARRIPKPEFLVKADKAVDAKGILASLKEDVAGARYPKKVRDLARLEAEVVELGAYASMVVHGLLQTEDYARALFRMRRPLLSEETIERQVAARMARQQIFERWPAPILSFVQEEATLRRPVGGRMVLKRQLERLLEIGQMRNVEIQVMPMDRDDNAGLGGSFQLLETKGSPKAAYVEVQQLSRAIVDWSDVHALEARYGIIRAQALTPRESLAFIEKLRGDT